VTAPAAAAVGTRGLGRTDLTVSQFGLGCARIGGIFKQEPAEFVNILSAAFDAGITFFDTSNIYSQGESEVMLGRAFRSRRDRVIFASKAGYVLPSQRQVIARLKPVVRPIIRALGLSRHHLPSAVRGSLAQDFSPAHVQKAIEGSLRRLRTDRLDLFQLHSPPVEVVERGEWADMLETLQKQGKIRYYGISCDTVDAARASLRYSGVSSIQVPINLLDRDFMPVIAEAHERGVGVIARECLANGMLIKNVTPEQIRSYCRTDEEAAAKAAQLEQHRAVAAGQRRSLTQLALQFVNGLDGVAVTLVGVSRLDQLQSLLASGLPSPSTPGPRAIPHTA
jgi:aryl-alcohol dehydrogenase-like predicted oxidoreductase